MWFGVPARSYGAWQRASRCFGVMPSCERRAGTPIQWQFACRAPVCCHGMLGWFAWRRCGSASLCYTPAAARVETNHSQPTGLWFLPWHGVLAQMLHASVGRQQSAPCLMASLLFISSACAPGIAVCLWGGAFREVHIHDSCTSRVYQQLWHNDADWADADVMFVLFLSLLVLAEHTRLAAVPAADSFAAPWAAQGMVGVCVCRHKSRAVHCVVYLVADMPWRRCAVVASCTLPGQQQCFGLCTSPAAGGFGACLSVLGSACCSTI